MDVLEDYYKQIKDAADELQGQKMPALTDELFSLYEQTGDRSKYEAVYFLRRKYLAAFGMLAILSGTEDAIHTLEDVILDICSEECWALPAHVDRINNKDWQITVELFASETAQALTEILSVLGNKLSASVRERAKSEIFRRVLTPFYQSVGEYAWWEHSVLNWCAVCNGAIGSASIYLMQDQPEVLKQGLDRICNSLSYYLNGFSNDGACLEGLSYFTYGMSYFTGFAKQLYDYTKGEQNLFKNPKVEKIAKFQECCYFTNGNTLSFSDGRDDDRFSMGLTSFLASQYESVHIPDLSLRAPFGYDMCFRFLECYRDYFWTKEYFDSQNVTSKEKKQLVPTILPDAQWFLCESKNGLGVAIKGGHNEEPHNHNDVGSFLFYCGNELFLPDLGAGEYTKDYFNANRYHIFCNNSFSHAVPIVNGMGQQEGREHRCRKFSATSSGIVTMDITDAYEKGSVDQLVRKIRFGRKNGTVTVEDSFIKNKNTFSIKESLISYLIPHIEQNVFVLVGQQNTCYIFVEGTNLSVTEVDHVEHDGTHRTIYQMTWEIPLIKSKTRFYITMRKERSIRCHNIKLWSETRKVKYQKKRLVRKSAD